MTKKNPLDILNGRILRRNLWRKAALITAAYPWQPVCDQTNIFCKSGKRKQFYNEQREKLRSFRNQRQFSKHSLSRLNHTSAKNQIQR